MSDFRFVNEPNQPEPPRAEVPIFDNSRGAHPSGVYGVEKVIYIPKTGSWMIVTSGFKVFVEKQKSPNTWALVDTNLAEGLGLVIKVDRLQWYLGDTEQACPWEPYYTEKAEIWTPLHVEKDELEAQPVKVVVTRKTAARAPGKVNNVPF